MTIVRPRLVDYYNVPITQEEVDFAIPFLDEDIPLYLDHEESSFLYGRRFAGRRKLRRLPARVRRLFQAAPGRLPFRWIC